MTSSFIIRRRDGSEYEVLVDAEDYDRVVAAGSWCIHKTAQGRTAYVFRNVRRDGKWTTEPLHRFLVPGAEEVDHRNENGLDNRKENLRAATRTQNQHNRSAYRSNTSGAKGVYRRGRKWAAQIYLDGHQHFLGTFESVDDARAAYAAAAERLHGEFANMKAGQP